MLRYFRKFTGDAKDRGASAVEYGLMVAAIAAVIVAIVFGLGGLVKSTFTDTCQEIQAGAAADGDPIPGDCGGAEDPDPEG
jgi:pilus assembly protein Flp/PilA